MDTVGAWLVHRAIRDRGAKVVGASRVETSLLEQVADYDVPARVRPEQPAGFIRLLAELGTWIAEAGITFVGLLGFFGATLVGFGNLIRRPRRFRLNAVVQRFDVVGVRALGIIGLMSFLIGIVIAEQGAVQLAQFGAEVYTINLIGRITVRELGMLMTAIMVAGRSGSAFAAQLGTMKLTEEIDAMRTIGVSPIEALVIPRMLAAVLMMPLLGFWAMLLALLGGGMFCWLCARNPAGHLHPAHAGGGSDHRPLGGLIKAPVFGLIIALSGCFQGMLVEGNGEEVGCAPPPRSSRRSSWSSCSTPSSPSSSPRSAGYDRRPEGPRVPIITVRGLSNSFGEQMIHDGPRPDVCRGEILGVVGGSGTGKSVLMRSIIGLQTPDAGEITVFGENMIGRSEDEAKNIRRRWGILFQDGALFSTLTVAENVQVPIREYFPLIRAAAARRDRLLQDRDERPPARRRPEISRPSFPAA